MYFENTAMFITCSNSQSLKCFKQGNFKTCFDTDSLKMLKPIYWT